jgi:hypothetical protein
MPIGRQASQRNVEIARRSKAGAFSVQSSRNQTYTYLDIVYILKKNHGELRYAQIALVACLDDKLAPQPD